MGILDELKKEAEAQKVSEDAARSDQQDKDEFYLNKTLPALRMLFEKLSELAETLNYLDKEITHQYDIPGVKGFDGLVQGGYKVSSDSSDQIKKVSFTFHCEKQGELVQLIENDKSASSIISYLHQHRIDFKSTKSSSPKSTGVATKLTIKPKVPISFVFSADLDQKCLIMLENNFEVLGTDKHILEIEKVNETFIEKFMAYAIRKETEFLRSKLDDESLEKLRKQLEEQNRQREQELAEADHRRELEEAKAKEEQPVNKLKSKFGQLVDKVKNSEYLHK